MRSLVLIVALFSLGSVAQAQDGRESRYGPRPDRAMASLSAASTYAGPLLGWSGKREPQVVLGPEASAPIPVPTAPSAPLSEPWRNLGARSQTLAVASPPQPIVPQSAPPPSVPPMSEPWRNLGVQRSSPEQPQPAAAAPAAVPTIALAGGPVAAPAPAPAQAPSLSRTYSVGRQYGLQPDALPPLKPNGMVFIASEDPPRARDDEPRHGSAEWLAAGARGDEDADQDKASPAARGRTEDGGF